ncbi:MAG: biopolymer transport protein ExbD [Planctomycetota bacterium]
MKIREDNWLDEEPNLTPMIDVVFLLLIFFMVTTTFLDPERAIDIELPRAESGAEAQQQQDELIVNVEEDGSFVLDGIVLSFDQLLERLKGAAQHNAETPVTIRGHRHAQHQAIVQVMDACGVAGLSNLAVGTSNEAGT